MKFYCTVILLVIHCTLHAQIKQVEQPTYKEFTPITTANTASTNIHKNNQRTFSQIEEGNATLIGQDTSSADQNTKNINSF